MNSISNKEIIFFDVGNVLVTFDHKGIISKLAKCLSVSQEDISVLLKKVQATNDLGMTRMAYEFYSLSKWSKATSEAVDIWTKAIAPCREMIAFVVELKKSGFSIGLTSNMGVDHLSELKANCLASLFNDKVIDHPIFSCETGSRKPQLQFFRDVEYLVPGIDFSRVTFVDDLKENLDSFSLFSRGKARTHLFNLENALSSGSLTSEIQIMQEKFSKPTSQKFVSLIY